MGQPSHGKNLTKLFRQPLVMVFGGDRIYMNACEVDYTIHFRNSLGVKQYRRLRGAPSIRLPFRIVVAD